MTHPLRAHIRTLELRSEELRSELSGESDGAQRIRVVDRIRALEWVLKFYRTGLELEEKLLPSLERDARIERLKRLRNELRTRLSSGEQEPMSLRKRLVEIADEINRLESGN